MSDSLADMLALAENWGSQETRAKQKKLQSGFYDLFAGLPEGMSNPALSKMFGPLLASAKKGTAGQYDLAKQNILSNLPVGGMQGRALSDLEGKRIETESTLPAFIASKIKGDLLDKSYGAAFNTGSSDTLHNMIRTAQSVDRAKQAQEEAGNNQLWSTIGELIATYGMYLLL